MIYSDEMLELDDKIDQLIAALCQSQAMQRYIKAGQNLQLDEDTQALIAAFQQAKRAFERVSEYGEYAPDYQEKKRAVQRAKRAMDFSSAMAEFRACQTELQALLDEVTVALANVVDQEIKVEMGNPFFNQSKHCGGNHCG